MPNAGFHFLTLNGAPTIAESVSFTPPAAFGLRCAGSAASDCTPGAQPSGTTPAHDSGSPTRPPVVGSTVTFTPRWKFAGSSPLSRCENCGRDCRSTATRALAERLPPSEWPRR